VALSGRGGGSAARPSAVSHRRIALGSVTAPTIRRGPAQRGQTRRPHREHAAEQRGPRHPSRRPRGRELLQPVEHPRPAAFRPDSSSISSRVS
jgi:hypothetical protein